MRFLDEQGWFGGRAGDPAELDAVRALRPRLRELWSLEEAELVPALNEILTEAEALPQLVDHDGLGWHIHAVPQEAPLATRMAVEAAMALIDVVRCGELDRLKSCAADDCDDVVRRPLPQPLQAVLRVRLRQPRERARLPGPQASRVSHQNRPRGSQRAAVGASRRWRTTSRANSTPEVIVSSTATARATAEPHQIRSPGTSRAPVR